MDEIKKVKVWIAAVYFAEKAVMPRWRKKLESYRVMSEAERIKIVDEVYTDMAKEIMSTL